MPGVRELPGTPFDELADEGAPVFGNEADSPLQDCKRLRVQELLEKTLLR